MQWTLTDSSCLCVRESAGVVDEVKCIMLCPARGLKLNSDDATELHRLVSGGGNETVDLNLKRLYSGNS